MTDNIFNIFNESIFIVTTIPLFNFTGKNFSQKSQGE